MSYDGFLSFGGTEIINAARTQAYVDHLLPTFGLQGCAQCEDLRHALGHGPYTSPFVDEPDWFDAGDANSWGFCGVYPLEVVGLDDAVRESTVTQLATDGAVMSAPRQRGREVRVSALLIGVDDAAVQFGLTWLRYALFGAACRSGGACTGDHLCYYSACPPICTDSPDAAGDTVHLPSTCEDGLITTVERACSLPYERNLYQVTVIDGPRVVERYDTECGAMVRVEWTFVAGVPWAYSTATYVSRSLDTSPSAIIPDVSCEAGTTSVRRRNLATNPVPAGNPAAAGAGWASADPAQWSVAADTTAVRLPGDQSVRVTRLVDTPTPNLATNPIPTGSLAGWAWAFGDYEQATVSLQTGAGPNGVNGFMRAAITAAKTGGWSGPSYTQDITHQGLATVGLWVRSSAATSVPLVVQAIGAEGDVLAAVTGPAVAVPANTWTQLGPVQIEVPAGSTRLRATAQFAPEQVAAVGATIDAAQVVAAAGGAFNSPVIGHLAFVGQQNQNLNTIQLMPGVVYAASIYARTSRPAFARIIATFYDASQTVIGTAVGALQATEAVHWARITAAFAAPEDAISATFEAIATRGDTGASTTGDQAWFTNMLLERTGATGVDAFGQFTAASFNIYYRTLGAGIPDRDWYTRGPVAAKQIIDSGVSIVGLQEIKHASRDPNNEQSRELVGWLNTTPGSSGQWTFANASRHVGFVYDRARVDRLSPVMTEDIVTLPALKRKGQQRVLGYARFKLLAIDREFWFITTHFPLRTEAPQPWLVDTLFTHASYNLLNRALSLELSAPTLVAGDFNNEVIPYRVMATHGFLTVQKKSPFVRNARYRSFNAWSTTQAGRMDGLWIDNLLTRSAEVTGAGLVMNFAPGTNTLPLVLPFASDHFMVTAQVQLTAPISNRQINQDAGTIPLPQAATTVEEQEAQVLQLAQTLDQVEAGTPHLEVDDVPAVAASGEGLVGSYFDGSFPDSEFADYGWTGTSNASISIMSVTLPTEVGPLLDPDCAVVPPAPRPPVLEIACLDTPDAWRRFTALVPPESVPVWRDAVPIISVTTGSLAARQVRVRFYPNPFMAAPMWLDPCDFCGEFVISYLPPNSTMTIDGIRQQADVAGPRGAVQGANHLLYASDGGPMSWPLLSCGVAYTAVVDVAPEGVEDLTVEICLSARE